MQRASFINDLVAQLLSVCDSPAEATSQAWQLLEHVLGQRKAHILTQATVALSVSQAAALADLVLQRVIARKPLQYLLGSVPFCDLTIAVQAPTLIPRPETEEWVSWLVAQLHPVRHEGLRILDLCTGTGCIALALAQAFPQAQVLGVDIAPEAVALAQRNAADNRLSNVTFVCADLWAGVPAGQEYDLIVSNPPYISAAEYDQLQPEVALWEDVRALKAEQQGLALYAEIAKKLPGKIKKNSILAKHHLPVMVVELGTDPHAVLQLFADKGLSELALHNDMQQVYRWLVGQI